MRGISKLHPEVQPKAYLLQDECKKIGIIIGFLDTERTEQEQNTIPSTNTKVRFPYSYHNWCIGIDFCIIKDGKIIWKTDCDTNEDHKRDYLQVGEIAKKLRFVYGGDWRDFKDYGHIQYEKLGTIKQLIAKYGTPEKFKAGWIKQAEAINKMILLKKEIIRSLEVTLKKLKNNEAVLPQINWCIAKFNEYVKLGGN